MRFAIGCFCLAVALGHDAFSKGTVAPPQAVLKAPKGLYFTRNGILFRANLDGTKAKKVTVLPVQRQQAELSPDGRFFAYTAFPKEAPGRQIGIFWIDSKHHEILTSISGTNSYGPRISPSGE